MRCAFVVLFVVCATIAYAKGSASAHVVDEYTVILRGSPCPDKTCIDGLMPVPTENGCQCVGIAAVVDDGDISPELQQIIDRFRIPKIKYWIASRKYLEEYLCFPWKSNSGDFCCVVREGNASRGGVGIEIEWW